MNFSSTYTIDSQALPGVKVRLRRLGPVERGEIELGLARERATQRDLSLQHEAARRKLDALLKASKKDGDGIPIEDDLGIDSIAAGMETQAIAAQLAAFERARIDAVFVRAALAGFEGIEELTYDGQPATADLLCKMGPDELFGEVKDAVNGNGYLSTEAARNLSSPSTSGAQADGKPTNSIAHDANPSASSEDETASLATPNT